MAIVSTKTKVLSNKIFGRVQKVSPQLQMNIMQVQIK